MFGFAVGAALALMLGASTSGQMTIKYSSYWLLWLQVTPRLVVVNVLFLLGEVVTASSSIDVAAAIGKNFSFAVYEIVGFLLGLMYLDTEINK